jgi:hypothetical protein
MNTCLGWEITAYKLKNIKGWQMPSAPWNPKIHNCIATDNMHLPDTSNVSSYVFWLHISDDFCLTTIL